MDTRELKKAVKDVLGKPCRVRSNGSFKHVAVDFGDFSWYFDVYDGADADWVIGRLKDMKGAMEILMDKGYRIVGAYEDHVRILREGLYTEDIYAGSAKEDISIMEENVKLFSRLEDFWVGDAPSKFADKNLYALLKVADEFWEKGYAVQIRSSSVGRNLYVVTTSFRVAVDSDLLYFAYPLVRFGGEILDSDGVDINGRFNLRLHAWIEVNGKCSKRLSNIVGLMKNYGIQDAEFVLGSDRFDVRLPFIYDNDQNVIEIL